MFSARYNRGLGLAAASIASGLGQRAHLTMIDVGANVGETVAVVESYSPDRFSFLCIEPDPEIAALCRLNHENCPRVHVERCFVGEREGMTVRLEDDGRANPSTVLIDCHRTDSDSEGKLLRLDTIAADFAAQNGGIDLIKIDTEGYDFSVLRSAEKLLKSYHPALYFEWYPALLSPLGESILDGFSYLANVGYRHFVFFASAGNYYCRISDPDELLLRSLASVASSDPAILYFDVFASTDPKVCDALTERSI
jgi:FkbM family methyltransferase